MLGSAFNRKVWRIVGTPWLVVLFATLEWVTSVSHNRMLYRLLVMLIRVCIICMSSCCVNALISVQNPWILVMDVRASIAKACTYMRLIQEGNLIVSN